MICTILLGGGFILKNIRNNFFTRASIGRVNVEIGEDVDELLSLI
jgi:hypothetical protein